MLRVNLGCVSVSKRIAASLGFAAVLTGTSLANAQPTQNAIPVANGDGLDTHLFRPALDSKGFFHTNGTDILGANDISFGLVIDYGRNLLRVRDRGQDDERDAHRHSDRLTGGE